MILKYLIAVRKVIQSTGKMGMRPPDYPELENFLLSDSPPIYAGVGSRPSEDQARHIPLFIKTARLLDKRIIISKVRPKSNNLSYSKDVFFIKNYPHEYLFPRTAAIIHHGGAGTTATATRSGRPQIIVPHILDQYYHGHRVFMSGLGANPVWRSIISLKTLIQALTFYFFNPDIQIKTKAVARSIQAEQSLANTIEIIEQIKSKPLRQGLHQI